MQTANPQQAKPFLEHMEDLRRTILWCLAALAGGMLVALPLTPVLLGLLQKPLAAVTDQPGEFLHSLEVSGAFSVTMKIGFWGGLLLSAPLILLFAGSFVFPGLHSHERRAVLNAAGLGVALFALGVYLGYRFTLPTTLGIMFGMHRWLGIRPEWTVTSYVAFSVQLLIAFGFVFEIPAVLLALGKMGIIDSSQLRHFRRHAIVAALVIGAVLTPPDVFSQLLMALPLIVLYEMCVWIVWATEKGRAYGSRGPTPRGRATKEETT